jgi:hypothetical protein
MNHAKVVGLPYRVKCVATENSVDLTLLFYFDIFFFSFCRLVQLNFVEMQYTYFDTDSAPKLGYMFIPPQQAAEDIYILTIAFVREITSLH